MKHEHYWTEGDVLKVNKRKEGIPDSHEVGFCVELPPRQLWVALPDNFLLVGVILSIRIILIIIGLWLVQHFFQLTIFYVHLDLVKAEAQENEHPNLRPQVLDALLTFFLVHFFPRFTQVRSLVQ